MTERELGPVIDAPMLVSFPAMLRLHPLGDSPVAYKRSTSTTDDRNPVSAGTIRASVAYSYKREET